jgi:hypothetical protein
MSMPGAAPASSPVGNEGASSSPDQNVINTEKSRETERGEKPSESGSSPNFKGTKHRYKAMGKEYEVEYDKLIERASKAHGAEERFSQAKKLEEETKARLSRLKDPSNEDWQELIELIGYDKAVKWARNLVWDEIQWEELPEAERRARLAEKKAQDVERKLSEREKAEAEARKQALEADAVEAVDREISEALEEARKEGIDPDDFPELVEYTVDTLMAYLEQLEEDERAGRQPRGAPPKPIDVIRQYKERFDKNATSYLKKIPAERLRSMLTPEQLSALRQAEIDDLYAPIPSGTRGRSKDADKPLSPIFDEKQPGTRGRSERRMKSDDWFKAMDRRFGG